MVSLHHVTHAVCLVVVAFLLKKYAQLSSAHASLQLELRELTLQCRPPDPARLTSCPCSCPALHPASCPPSDVRTEFEARSQPSRDLSKGGEMRSAAKDSPEDEVDEFGRSAGSHERKPGFQPSLTFSPKQQLPALDRVPVQTVLSSSASESEASASPRADGLTEGSAGESVSLSRTSESLESVRASPSPGLPAEVRAAEVATPALGGLEGEYYLGSMSGEGRGEEDSSVIVTSGVTMQGQALDPYAPLRDANSHDDEEYEYYTEEEEEAEPEPHPAFGKVELEWVSEAHADHLSRQGSSMRCTGTNLSDRTCMFRNLCYKPLLKQFVFLQAGERVQDLEKESQALLELSTVAGHNTQYFSYHSVPSSDIKSFQVAMVASPTVVFKRFKPDNIMHVFHDDVIPLFQTLMDHKIKPVLHLTRATFPVSLFLADLNNEGEFFSLYQAIASKGAFTAESLTASVQKKTTSDSLVCFPEAFVGLSKQTTWYQYGFFTPQGPIAGSAASSIPIHGASSLLLNSVASSCTLCSAGGHLVLVSRKETRRMLNEMDLVLAISKRFQLKVMTVSLETHGLSDILPILHSSRGVIGMHGSLLSLAAFLRQGSIVVELFPYAVQPANYSPFATLCRLPGMFLAYRAWTNRYQGKSVGHPDWTPEFGGLVHLL